MATDELSDYYRDLLSGSYDCVDRIVLNGYFALCYSPGGFRSWWRALHDGSDDALDNAHLMRMAGRFARRLRAYAEAHRIPVIESSSEERKHQIAGQYLREHPRVRGLFLVLVARAAATVWEVQKSAQGVIRNLQSKRAFIKHYSFHIMDADWGHITIKMAGHPPFAAQIMLNGHEYVACQAHQQKIRFTISDDTLDELPSPSQVGGTRVGGIDINKPRIRAVLSAPLALAFSPGGFTVGQFAAAVRSMSKSTATDYDARRAAYDLKKLRGKNLIGKIGKSRRYQVPPAAIRTMGALLLVRERLVRPILSAVRKHSTKKPPNQAEIDQHYQAVRQTMVTLLNDLRIAA